jgi:N-carbamoylputrescine amidase
MQFWGGSFVGNAFGRVDYQAPHDQETVHVQAVDLAEADYYRTHWPFLRDRRIDSYQPINQRFIDQG